MSRKLLVVDDDEGCCRLVRAIFTAEGFDVIAAGDARSGLERAARDQPDVIILDRQLPDLDGVELLDRLRATCPNTPIVILTAHGEVKSAVRATQLGAFDYQTKPIDPEDFTLVIKRALETRSLRTEVEDLRRRLGEGGDLATKMGPSREIARVVDQVRTVASTDFSVLVLGETGTGKELVAQAVHRQSERRGKPFIALDCGAIPEALLESELFGHEKGAFTGAERRKQGRFQVAEGGTLFLDEVGNLPLGLQAKLLRVLESRQLHAVGSSRAASMDVRFVAATNDDLEERVAAGKFRADLYFRLAQYTISLPALRDRTVDVGHLAKRFLEEVSVELRRATHQIDPDAISALERYSWPGNVRELRNVVRQAVLESKGVVLRRADLQRFLGKTSRSKGAAPKAPGCSLKEAAASAAREAERLLITETLRTLRGNKSQAARALQTDYKTLHVKMKSLGIRGRDFGP